MNQIATTVEMDNTHFDDLKSKLIGNKENKPNNEVSTVQEKISPESKKFTFKKGEKSFDIDDDAEIEFMADKRPIRLTLKELKDRAAGDIAVKNRMHALAEEKKRVSTTFKQFAELSKSDPLAALEFISNKAKEADGEFEYNKYLEKLADQAEKLGQMDEKERKALELEKKLNKAESDLSLKEREALAIRRKQEILSDYPEIGDRQFGQMVDAILNNPDLLEGVEDENGVLDKVEDLIQETLTQRDIISVINELNPAYSGDNDLVFSLSDQIRQNPDLDEEDIRDIIREIVGTQQRSSRVDSDIRQRQNSVRQNDTRILSEKQRQSVPPEHLRAQGASDLEILKMRLLENKEKNKRTPLYMR